MNRKARQEIRRVLMGRTDLAEDGRLVAIEKGRLRIPFGIADGAGAACFFGISKKARRLDVSCSMQKARSSAVSVMQDIGRELYLPEQPEAAACLIRYVLTRPAVLIFDYQNNVPMLTAWTGRGLTGWISLRRALKAFLKRMPKQFTLSDKPLPKDSDAEQKKLKKKEKRDQRNNRKTKAGDTVSDAAEKKAEE